jgi:hypothetical protein
MIINIV